jgi:hypothetical protein
MKRVICLFVLELLLELVGVNTPVSLDIFVNLLFTDTMEILY